MITVHGTLAPEHLACAAEVSERHRLKGLAERGGGVLDALVELWSDRVTLAGGDGDRSNP